MYSVKITLTPVGSLSGERADQDEGLDSIWYYLACLYKNGQILRDYEVTRNNEVIAILVTSSTTDALDERYNNIYAQEYGAQVKQFFDMSLEIVGQAEGHGGSCSCEQSSWYVLMPMYGSPTSPVVCADCGDRKPVYKLPYLFGEDEHFAILGWAEAYNSVDKLWFYGLSDRFTYRQMSKADSQRSVIGREIAAELEKQTRTAVYYHLFYNPGKVADRCPVCGSAWEPVDCAGEAMVRCQECRLIADGDQ